MIERFYDPASGSVEYQGHDLKSLNVHWYRDQIGYVGQEPTLFNESIAKNIAYGAPDATRADIEEAARQANAHTFIESFANGYDTSGKLNTLEEPFYPLLCSNAHITLFLFCFLKLESEVDNSLEDKSNGSRLHELL